MLHRIKRTCKIFLCVMALFLLLPAGQVRAEEGIKSPGVFDNLEGDAKYLEKDYRNNYILDIEETSVLEVHFASINGIANALFAAIRYLALATVTVFYYAVTFDVGDIFRDEISSIQAALNDTVFEPLLMLAIFACLFMLLIKFARRDIVGGAVELGKAILVIVLSMLVVAKSDVALSNATNITKEIGIEALASVNDTGGLPQNKEDFAAEAAGILWVDLVHEPWKTVEFLHSGEPDDGVIQDFLTTSDAEERAELVKDFGEDAACFKMTIGFERIGFLLIYLIPCIAKCALFIIIAGALLIFQILAVFYLILAVIMLLLFLFAGYESILGAWLKKLLETQVMILVLMIMLSLLIRTDVFLFEKVGEYGWFVVLVIQIIIGVGLYIGRGQIFTMLSTVQRGTTTPRYVANRLKMGGNINQLGAMQKKAVATSQRVMQRHVQATRRNAASGGTAAGRDAAAQHTPRPVFQAVQTAAANIKPAMSAAGAATAQAGKTVVQTGIKAGKQTGAYIQSGGLGRHMGMAAGVVRNAAPAMKDSFNSAMELNKERIRSAPIQFQYGVYQQTEKLKENAAALKTDMEHKTEKAFEYIGEKAITAGVKMGETYSNNFAGAKEGYEQNKKHFEAGKAARREKQEAYKRSVEVKRQMLQDVAANKAANKDAKRERPKFQSPKKEESI